MKVSARYRGFLSEAKKDPAYWAAVAAASFTEMLHEELVQRGMSRTQYADRLGTSRAYVTQVLGGNDNFTLETMAKLALALGLAVEVKLRPLAVNQNAAYERIAGAETGPLLATLGVTYQGFSAQAGLASAIYVTQKTQSPSAEDRADGTEGPDAYASLAA
jgi:transcriptional regulator with XRE-family HTH domain